MFSRERRRARRREAVHWERAPFRSRLNVIDRNRMCDLEAMKQGTSGGSPALQEAGAPSEAIVADVLVPAHLLDGGEIVIFAIKPSLWFVIFSSVRWLAAM